MAAFELLAVHNSQLVLECTSLCNFGVHVHVQIYVAPEQWSFPLRLPSAFFGIFNSTSIRDGERYPWSADFDHRVLTVNTSKGWALSAWLPCGCSVNASCAVTPGASTSTTACAPSTPAKVGLIRGLD